MKWDQERQLVGLIHLFGLLQLRLEDQSASKDEIEGKCREILRQLTATLRNYQDLRDHGEKLDVARKREIEALYLQVQSAERRAAAANSRADAAIRDATAERVKRYATEDEIRSALQEIAELRSSGALLDFVCDIQECPNCGTPQLDREANDSCICRACGGHFAIDFPDS